MRKIIIEIILSCCCLCAHEYLSVCARARSFVFVFIYYLRGLKRASHGLGFIFLYARHVCVYVCARVHVHVLCA